VTKELAATAAQIMPVLSFAVVALLFPARKALSNALKPPRNPIVVISILVALCVYGLTLWLQVEAEIQCLTFLRVDASAAHVDAKFVTDTIIWSMVYLTIFPVVGSMLIPFIEHLPESRMRRDGV